RSQRLCRGPDPPRAEPGILRKPFELVSDADRARLPDDVVDAYPLTELQAGMLFHSELDPLSALYHDVLSYHVRVPGDPAAFAAALGDVVAAHPVLRTSIHIAGFSEPLQLVHRACEAPLAVHDIRAVPLAEQEHLLADFFTEQRHTRPEW